MPRARFEKLSPDRRRQILEAAAREFAEHGYRGASLNHVIERLGLSKGAFYYYFDDKADLFASAIGLVWELILPPETRSLEGLTAETFWPALESIARNARDRLLAEPWTLDVTRLLYNPPADPKVRRLVATRFAEGHAIQEAWLLRGRQLGVVRVDLPDGLLLGLLAAVDGAANRWLLDNWNRLEAAERDRISDCAFRLLETLLEPPAGRCTSPEAT